MQVSAETTTGAIVRNNGELSIPYAIVVKWRAMMRDKVSGQLIINFNAGDPQSFEMKEHHRL